MRGTPRAPTPNPSRCRGRPTVTISARWGVRGSPDGNGQRGLTFSRSTRLDAIRGRAGYRPDGDRLEPGNGGPTRSRRGSGGRHLGPTARLGQPGSLSGAFGGAIDRLPHPGPADRDSYGVGTVGGVVLGPPGTASSRPVSRSSGPPRDSLTIERPDVLVKPLTVTGAWVTPTSAGSEGSSCSRHTEGPRGSRSRFRRFRSAPGPRARSAEIEGRSCRRTRQARAVRRRHVAVVRGPPQTAHFVSGSLPITRGPTRRMYLSFVAGGQRRSVGFATREKYRSAGTGYPAGA